MRAHDIIKRPILTEKSYAGIANKIYTFEVAKDANKVQIRKAIEEIFSVSVESVNTVSVKGHKKSQNTKQGRTVGKTNDYKKAVVTLSVNESYELNDGGCDRIRRLEENLYKDFLPKGYKSEDVITYQWQQNRETNLKGHFNFYYNVNKNSVSRGSMFLYLVLLTIIGVAGNLIADLISSLLGL